MANKDMEKIVAHAKNSGFVYQGSEIYDGLANTWDYGPLGVEMKNNIKKLWWKRFIQESPYNVGLDSAIFMNPRVWQASGHVGGFSDPLIDCKSCKTRHRADKLIEDYDPDIHSDGWEPEKMMAFIREHHIQCPDCGSEDFTDIREFELMFKTEMGTVKGEKNIVYLRPETAQGIFVNFKNIQRTSRKKVPFGIGQIGKSFRNEITPGNFIFRTREFEQMELEFFCKPDTDLEWFDYWKNGCMQFLLDLGLTAENLRFRDHEQAELSFYSKATSDIEYLYPTPLNWGELWGIADRTDYDLSRHQEFSKKNLEYLDPETNKKYIPYVIEPSVGADRLFLSVLADAYDEEQLEKEITTNLDQIVEVTDITSSNPYDYTKNEFYKNIVKLGKDAVPVLENMYKNKKLSGVNAYLSALAIQDITKCDLHEEYNLDWATAEEFYTLWEDNNCSFKK